MKIHRVHLRDFKGVTDSEVFFELDGVTIVEGPNEIGKSSLSEALTLVLEELDSSNKLAVRNAKPVHRDAGPWVEVELSTGDYHLIIEKRWARSPMTHLLVLAPRAEELTSRAAHLRLREILAETLDEPLFSALHQYQGVSMQQAVLGGSSSLSAALDAAASGESTIGLRETNLIGLVEKEWLRHFTATGRPAADRTNLGQRVSDLEVSIRAAETDLDSLEALGDRHRFLLTESERLATSKLDNQRSLEGESTAWQAIQAGRLVVAQAETLVSNSRSALLEATRQTEDRNSLKESAQSAVTAAGDAEAAVAKDKPVLEAALIRFNTASDERDGARRVRDEAERDENIARRDEEYLRRVRNRGLWSDRLGNARAGQVALSAARAILSSNLVDEEILGRLEDASRAVLEAKVQLDAASTEVAIEALKGLALQIQGVSEALKPGDVSTRRVDGELSFTVDDVVTVRISTGSSEVELRGQLEDAEAELRSLLSEAGLGEHTTSAEFRVFAQQRRDATSAAIHAERQIASNVRDLTIERLAQEFEDNDAIIANLEVGIEDEPVTPSNEEEAQARLSEASRAREVSSQRLEASETELSSAREQQEGAVLNANGRSTNLQIAQVSLDAAQGALTLARNERSDEQLASALEGREREFERAERSLSEAQEALAVLDPDSVEERLNNLKAVEESLKDRLTETERELLQAKTTLEVRGNEGLHDQLESLLSDHEQAVLDRDRRERAARAADLARTIVLAHRDETQRSYVAPYRDEIERLGRIVYGPRFAVEIDHTTLEIEKRTLDGVTLEYGQLSTGAKEQLCILMRLACAAIVARGNGEGAPVIIDDALGWSDRTRLERMGTAIAAASRRSQVIILTCEPSRYSSVGAATVRRLVTGQPG